MKKFSITLAICSFMLLGFAKAQNRIFGSDNVAELRLVGGNRCAGRLEIRPADSSLFGQACDLDAGNNEARAICRQLGCNTIGSERVADPTRYGFSRAVNVYRGFGYTCTGNENALTDCRRDGSRCAAGDADYAIAISCNGAMKTAAVDALTVGLLALVLCAVKWI